MVTWTRSSIPRLQFFRKETGRLVFWPMVFGWGSWIAVATQLFPAEHPKVVTWLTEQSHDFGDLPAGRPVTHIFRFQNVGADTILLQTVRTTCGCTAVRYPETPVAPGATGELTVDYDAAQSGRFRKKIRVFFDRQRKPEILWIKGEVEQ